MGNDAFYARLAEIQGIGHETPPGIERDALPHRDLRPKTSTVTYGGKQVSYVSWHLGNVITSQSPASAWATSGDPKSSWPDLLRRLFEALELPGSVADYHQVILRAFDALWERRREDPDILPEVERLCLLDLKLMEIHPDLTRVFPNTSHMVHVPATAYLIRLYEREGSIAEALDVARRGVDLGQEPSESHRLEALLRDLEAEDAV